MSIHVSSSPPHPSSIPLPLDKDWDPRHTCQLSSWCSNFCMLPPALNRGDPCTQERSAETMVWPHCLRRGQQEALPLLLSGYSLGNAPPSQGFLELPGEWSLSQELGPLARNWHSLSITRVICLEVDLAAPVKPSDGCGSAKIFAAASRQSWSLMYEGQPLLSVEPWKSYKVINGCCPLSHQVWG